MRRLGLTDAPAGGKGESRTAADRRAGAIVALGLDTVLAEVASALAGHGVRSLLLKGPAIARWLYDDPAERAYGDIDLLVDPERFGQAEAVLAALGFEPRDVQAADHHTVWARERMLRATVELHRSLFWAQADPETVWPALSLEAGELVIAGTTVEVPSVPARLVVVTLHAAQHGVGFDHALADLHRAVQQATPAEWKAAAGIADEIGAREPFAAGLRIDPRGATIADALSLPAPRSRELTLRLLTPPATTDGFERLFMAGRLRDRVRLIEHECFPGRTFMRIWQPVARRGSLGMAAAYVWRPFWLLSKAPRGFRAWRRVDRLHRHTSPADSMADALGE